MNTPPRAVLLGYYKRRNQNNQTDGDLSLTDVAKHLSQQYKVNISRDTVSKWFKNEGFSLAKQGDSKPDKKILEGWLPSIKSGKLSLSAIARKYNVSVNAVEKWFKSSGITLVLQEPAVFKKCAICGKSIKREVGALRKLKTGEVVCSKECQNERQSRYNKKHGVVPPRLGGMW